MVLLGTFDAVRLYRRTGFPVKKDWSYWIKLGLVGAFVAANAINTSLQIELHSKWIADVRFFAAALGLLASGIALAVHYLEQDRSRIPRGVLLFYWLLFNCANAIKVRSLIVRHEYKNNKAEFITVAILEGLALVVFFIEWLVPKPKPEYSLVDEEDDEKKCPMDDANIFSILTFEWMTGTMKLGYQKFLTEEDLWHLRKRDTAHATETAFTRAWEKQLKKKKPSLWIALFQSFGWPYFVAALFKIVQDILNYSQPQLLRLLIAFAASYETDSPQPAIRGAAIAITMFVLSVIQTITLHQYFQHSFETGMRFKTALTAAIYKKSMVLSNEGRAAKSTGDIVNLQAVDAQRLQDICQYGQQVWSSPFQILLCMVSLYQLLGPSMFAGIGVMVLMVPVNGFIAKFMKKLQKTQMKNKDSRTRLMTEILNNMKAIKLYAWTSAFMDKLNYVRNDLELKTLKKIGVTQSLSNFTWSTTPFLVSCKFSNGMPCRQ